MPHASSRRILLCASLLCWMGATQSACALIDIGIPGGEPIDQDAAADDMSPGSDQDPSTADMSPDLGGDMASELPCKESACPQGCIERQGAGTCIEEGQRVTLETALKLAQDDGQTRSLLSTRIARTILLANSIVEGNSLKVAIHRISLDTNTLDTTTHTLPLGESVSTARLHTLSTENNTGLILSFLIAPQSGDAYTSSARVMLDGNDQASWLTYPFTSEDDAPRLFPRQRDIPLSSAAFGAASFLTPSKHLLTGSSFCIDGSGDPSSCTLGWLDVDLTKTDMAQAQPVTAVAPKYDDFFDQLGGMFVKSGVMTLSGTKDAQSQLRTVLVPLTAADLNQESAVLSIAKLQQGDTTCRFAERFASSTQATPPHLILEAGLPNGNLPQVAMLASLEDSSSHTRGLALFMNTAVRSVCYPLEGYTTSRLLDARVPAGAFDFQTPKFQAALVAHDAQETPHLVMLRTPNALTPGDLVTHEMSLYDAQATLEILSAHYLDTGELAVLATRPGAAPERPLYLFKIDMAGQLIAK